MSRPSEPLLAWLRNLLTSKGLNTAHVADLAKLDRARVRKILSGKADMTVDELMQLSDALEIDPTDLAQQRLPDDASFPEPRAVEEGVRVDAFGNHPEQLFRVAFMLGCDFVFLATISKLGDAGVPPQVLSRYADGRLPIELVAAYHAYNEPRYDAHGITLTLSFDALYECHFPWDAIERFILTPVPPEETPEASEETSEEPAKNVPFLRLVT